MTCISTHRPRRAAAILGAAALLLAAPHPGSDGELRLAAPAAAQPMPSMAELEILPGWRDGSGRHVAGLRISLDPGWKTYWRAPGDAGIPPHFDWSGSRNIAGAEVLWPAPEVFTSNGLTSVGYVSDVILPIVFTPRDPDRPIRLEGRVDLGVCENICVPVSMKVSAALEPGARSADPRIVAAMDARPSSGAQAGAGPLTCAVTPTEGGLRLNVEVTLAPRGAGEHAVVELGRAGAWVSEAELVRDGDRLSSQVDVVPPRGAPFMLDRSQVRLTVLGPRGAVDMQGCTGG
ncbi:protein-disulfide reductase DsbD domain-containing protein [Profundibacterium mesophilum]|uniref:Histidine ammonia-lyase n=1 Tax=Profundibacterium mesophilum KAUST100406-0324 TaxID=1037889 RepID=A0A921NWC7_9RHOB|nr:protein-disulfide reductase DsbD domain-containing protein [Profundibacterium mesophilum]KAF0675969.1 histidine ammonia-lyase [Profundibacterium mesophilum KAUST100406-0324]